MTAGAVEGTAAVAFGAGGVVGPTATTAVDATVGIAVVGVLVGAAAAGVLGADVSAGGASGGDDGAGAVVAGTVVPGTVVPGAAGVVAVAVAGAGVTGAGVTAAEHAAKETLLVSIVTAPVRARARPAIVAPVVRLMLSRARILPTKVVVVPMVAELPTCQKTLQGEPPLITWTVDALAVVSVLPVLKIKTALALPWASRVSVPVSCADEV